jgi:hypothetical protein
MQDSKNRHIIQIQSTTSYQENWLTVLKTQNPFGISESSAPLGSTILFLKIFKLNQIEKTRQNYYNVMILQTLRVQIDQ